MKKWKVSILALSLATTASIFWGTLQAGAEGIRMFNEPPFDAYKVSQGDTFYFIAQRYGLDYKQLMAFNPSVDPQNLQVGSTIRLKAPSSSVSGFTYKAGDKVQVVSKAPAYTKMDMKSGFMGYVYPGSELIIIEQTTPTVVLVKNSQGQRGYVSVNAIKKMYSTPTVKPQPVSNGSRAWEAKADAIIAEGMKFLGKGKTEYVYGATRYIYSNGNLNPNFDPTEFDCSSFTQYIFYKHGIKLNAASRSQFLGDGGFVVGRNQLRKGDLVFFATSGTASKYDNDDYRANGHVGVVKEVRANGEIDVLHTYSPSTDVAISTMYPGEGWWDEHFLYGRRVMDDNGNELKDVVIDKETDLSNYVYNGYSF